jgi:AcrR family transcriptional regulator
MPDKTDRRIKYTKMVLKQSLLNLMRDHPIEKISVKDLCEKADINRGTFYTHYSDPYDLLGQIENELFNDILVSLESSLKADAISALLAQIFAAIEKNRELCMVLFSEYGDKVFLKRVMLIARDRSIAEWKKILPSVGDKQLDMLYTFYANGCIAIIQHWIQNGMKESPDELTLFIDKISTLGLLAFK